MRTRFALPLSLLLPFALGAQLYTITTLAGGAPPPTPSPALKAAIGLPTAVTSGPAGSLYFTSLNCVFKIDSKGTLTLIAGTSRYGYSGDGGPAIAAQLANPSGVAADPSGNIYIADTGNSRVRKVSPSGIITTIAGGGNAEPGDGGPAISAQLSNTNGIALDASGNLFIAESGSRIRRVSAAGIITTIAGHGGQAGFSGDGGLATAAQLANPNAVAVDPSGNVYISDRGTFRIRKVSTAGIITTIAGNGNSASFGDGGLAIDAQFFPFGVAADASGNVYIADFTGGRIRKVLPTGIITSVGGDDYLGGPSGIGLDASGNIYIADFPGLIQVVSSTGVLTTIAGTHPYSFSGDGGPATSAQFSDPRSVAVDGDGNVYIGDRGNSRVRKVAPTGIVTTFAGGGGSADGDGGPATEAQVDPEGLAIDTSGNLYVADAGGQRIRKISKAGIITTVAGNGTFGFSGDGGPATSAQLGTPQSVAVDAAGNVYIADTGNYRIRKVSAQGIITTIAGTGSGGYSGDGGPATSAQIGYVLSITADAHGNVYAADGQNNRLRKIAPTGIITTIAGTGDPGFSGDGGPATGAEVSGPSGVAVDASGTVFLSTNGRIRTISPAGIIATIAGNDSGSGYSGDGGFALAAKLTYPSGIAVDSADNVYVADSGNNAIRKLTPIPASCTYSVPTTSFAVSAGGQILQVALSTPTSCPWSVYNLPDWVTLNGPSFGSGPTTLTLLVAASSVPPRAATLSVANVAVSISQASDLLFVSDGGVVNAASFTGPVAPGSLTAVFGNFLISAPVFGNPYPLPTQLGGISFEFDDKYPAPLFYVSYTQANVQLPWELLSGWNHGVAANLRGRTSAEPGFAVSTYAPGIFSVNGNGTGQGAIVDPNNRLADATNPARAGTYVQIYCTGLGPVTNQPATGSPASATALSQTPTLPIVSIGGAQAFVSFSGLTPGYVGLYQVNAQIPAESATGDAVPLNISIGGAMSNTVTIAVQ